MKTIKIKETLSVEVLKRVVETLRSGGVVLHPADTCYGLMASVESVVGIEKVRALKGRGEQKPFSLAVSSRIMLEKYAVPEEGIFKYLPGEVTFVLKARKHPLLLPLGKGESKKKGWYINNEHCSSPLLDKEEGEGKDWCVNNRHNFPLLNKEGNKGRSIVVLDGTVGIRWTKSKLMSQIIEALGCPVITTSANVSGQPSCYTVEEFEKQKQLQQASKQGLTLSDIGNWFSQGWPEGSEEMLVALDGGVIPPVPPSTVVKVIEGKWEVLREGRKRVIKSQSDRVMES